MKSIHLRSMCAATVGFVVLSLLTVAAPAGADPRVPAATTTVSPKPAAKAPTPVQPAVLHAAAGQFVPVPEVSVAATTLAAGATTTVTVTGAHSVPAIAQVSAVAITVTATAPTGSGYLQAYTAGTTRLSTDKTVPFTSGSASREAYEVVVPSSSGQITVYASAATGVSVHLRGYYTTAAATTPGGTYVPVTPMTVVNAVAVVANGTTTVTFAGANGLPAVSSIEAVAVSVTSAAPAGNGCVSAYPAGGSAADSSICAASAMTAAGFDTVTLSSAGAAVFSSTAATTLTVRVRGYYTSPTAAAAGGSYVPLTPAVEISGAVLAAGGTTTTTVTGVYGVPAVAGVSAVVMNDEATAAGAAGCLTYYPGGTRPIDSTTCYPSGGGSGDDDITAVSATGTVTAYSSAASTVTSVLRGYFAKAAVPGAPTAVTGTASNGKVTVSWTAPAGDGGADITGYMVTASPGSVTATTTGATTAVVTGLTNGTPYTFTVKAINGVGTGAASAASATIVPITPEITYGHDDLGRMTAVFTSTGDGSKISYDQVGNIIGITALSATTLAVAQISPERAVRGGSVDLYGTDFGTTLSAITVKFNGTAGTVTALHRNRLTVTVPGGATSGAVTVTIGSTTATYSGFVVNTTTAPTTTALSASLVNIGDPVTVTGTGFNTDPTLDVVSINGTITHATAATATSVSFANPPTRSFGHVTVKTPTGSATTTGDLVSVPAPFAATDVAWEGRVTTAGVGTVIAFPTVQKIALALFDVAAGQRAMVAFTNATLSDCFEIHVYNPGQTVAAHSEAVCGDEYFDLPDKTTAGTYEVEIQPESTDTGQVTLTVQAATDVTKAITIDGGAGSLTTTTAGQHAIFTFPGTHGQRVFTKITNVGNVDDLADARLIGPDGVVVANAYSAIGDDPGDVGYIDTATLPLNGTYQVVVDPRSTIVGTYTVAVTSVPADVVHAGTIGGAAVSFPLTTIGQNGKLTFSGTAGQEIFTRVALTGIGVAGVCVNLTIQDATLDDINDACVSSASGYIVATTLPDTGSYTIAVDPAGVQTATAALTLVAVPADAAVAAAADGTARSTTLTYGQAGDFTFTGTVGQRVFVSGTIGGAPDDVIVMLLAPDGSTVATGYEGPITTRTLTQAGTYTVVIRADDDTIGTATVTIWTVAADKLVTLTPNGTAGTATTTTPGQGATYTYTATAGQQMVVTCSDSLVNAAGGTPTLRLLDPSGTQVDSSSSCGSTTSTAFTQVAATTGTYSITMVMPGLATGSVTLQITETSSVTATMTLDGTPTTVTTTAPGQQAKVTFTTTAANQTVYVVGSTTTTDASDDTTDFVLNDPSGTRLASNYLYTTAPDTIFEPIVLAAAGTYTIVVSPPSTLMGTITLRAYNSFVTATLPLDGTQTTVTTTKPGQKARVTFTTTAANQTVYMVGSTTTTDAGDDLTEFYLKDPTGTQITSSYLYNTASDTIFEPLTLATAGTYTLQIEPPAGLDGTITLRAFNSFVTGTLPLDGTPTAVTTTKLGQQARVTFTTTAANQTVYMVGTTTTTDAGDDLTEFYLNDSTGTQITSSYLYNTAPDTIFEPLTLATAGTYSIRIEPPAGLDGTITLRAFNSFATATTTVNGTAATVTTTKPGQQGQVMFASTAANQTVYVVGSTTTTDAGDDLTYFYLNNSAGTQVSSGYLYTTGTQTIINGVVLPTIGIYTIRIEPPASLAGTMTVGVTTTKPAAIHAPAAKASPAHPTATPTITTPPLTTAHAVHRRGVIMTPAPAAQWPSSTGPPVWSQQPTAPANDASLTGRVLNTAGKPLAHITVSIDGTHRTHTNGDGRFTLTGLPEATRVLRMDGRTASTRKTTYGVFDVQVHLKAGRNTLFYTPYLPALDTAHEVNIPSPTTSEVVLTNPGIPGLEVHIPAGVTIVDADGHPVHEVGITPIPVNRTPIPMPQGVQVPVYYTIQPAGGHLIGGDATIVYPNYLNQKPGTPVNFWHYEKYGEGWEVYGGGTVNATGTQVNPNPGTHIEDFDGAMINVPGWLKALKHMLGDVLNFAGDPVDLQTGLLSVEQTDLTVSDVAPLQLTRAYNSGDTYMRPAGTGWNDLYDTFLSSDNQYQEADLNFVDGSTVHFVRTTPGNAYATAAFAATGTTTAFAGSVMTWNGAGWNLRRTDGTVLVYGENAPLQKIIDAHGNTISVIRASKNSFNNYIGDITEVRSPNGYWLQYTYDSSDRITQVTDDAGRSVEYTYDTASGNGHLQTVTDVNGGVTHYAYDSNGRLHTITDARNNISLTNTYDANGRIATQTLGGGISYTFAYTLTGTTVTSTTVTDNTGHARTTTFDANGREAKDTVFVGTASPRQVTVTRDPATLQPGTVTDGLGRTATSTYDASGQVTADTQGTGATQLTDSATYNNTPFGQPDTVTDPNGHTTSYTYNSAGDALSSTDPLSHTVSTSYNAQGQALTNQDGFQQTRLTMTYDRGAVATTTDAAGHTTRYFTDAAGRVVLTTLPDGTTSQIVYDPANHILKTIDPHGGVTQFGYDPNGNETSLTDARQTAQTTPKSTVFTYDTADRLTRETDPLGNHDDYTYDASGRMATHTDARGKVAAYTYDTLGRISTIGFGRTGTSPNYTYESTLTYTYNPAGLQATITDSTPGAGTVTYGYDTQDRLTSEQVASGTITYTYDKNSNIKTVTPTGMTQSAYGYDNANRLTSLTQGSLAGSTNYDADNRPTSETLPNGVQLASTYDTSGHLATMTYTKGASTIGDLSYTYDADGHVITVTGSLAAVTLPAPESGETYDVDNRLTSVGGATRTYDTAGHLTANGSNTYTWNARGQLITTTGTQAGTDTYDPSGRLATSTVGAITTTYRYSGTQQIGQNQTDGASLSYLLGGTHNTVVAATDNTGTTQNYLVDALGSTLALTDNTGAITAAYTYGPFGQTTAPVGDTNPIRFTGQPAGPSLAGGLQYNSARFYSAADHRFISSDPAGFGSGTTDLYEYADGDPVDNTDPSGEFVQYLVACGIGGLVNDFGGWLNGSKHSAGDYLKGAARGCVGGLLFAVAPVLLGGAMRLFTAETVSANVLFDTNAVFSLKTAMALLQEGETPVITQTVIDEIADVASRPGNPFSNNIPEILGLIEEDSGIGNRMLALWYLRGLGAAEQGIYGDAAIAATAVETGIPVVTGDRALYWTIKLLGGTARWLPR